MSPVADWSFVSVIASSSISCVLWTRFNTLALPGQTGHVSDKWLNLLYFPSFILWSLPIFFKTCLYPAVLSAMLAVTWWIFSQNSSVTQEGTPPDLNTCATKPPPLCLCGCAQWIIVYNLKLSMFLLTRCNFCASPTLRGHFFPVYEEYSPLCGFIQFCERRWTGGVDISLLVVWRWFRFNFENCGGDIILITTVQICIPSFSQQICIRSEVPKNHRQVLSFQWQQQQRKKSPFSPTGHLSCVAGGQEWFALSAGGGG